MAFIPTPYTGKFEMFFTHNSQQVENVYHVTFAANPTVTDLQAMAAIFVSWWNTNMKAKVRAETVLTAIKATDISSQTGPSITTAAGLPLTGTFASGGPIANSNTVAVKWLTDFRGRSFRGRTYHVGLHASSLVTNAQSITTTEVTNLQTAYNALVTAVAAYATGTHLTVVSFVTGGVNRAQGLPSTITTCQIDATLDSQRRRLPGRGK